MIYQCLSTTLIRCAHSAGVVVRVSRSASVCGLILLIIGVVIARHGCLPPREHRVVWNCAVTGTCRFCSAFWCTPVKDVAFLLEETSTFALYFIIVIFQHSRYFFDDFFIWGDFLNKRVIYF